MAVSLDNGKKHDAEALCIDYDDSLRRLYAGCFDSLVGYLRAHFRSCPHQAEEIAHNAFERMAARGKPGTVDNIRAFLWRTARNIALSDLRSRRVAQRYRIESRQALAQEDDHSLTPERILAAREQVAIAVSCLRAMPEQRRRAFILTRIEGLSHAEASETMGVSRPAVSKHVARAAADIYAALGEDTPNPEQRDD